MSTKEETTALVERIKAGAPELMPELWDSVKNLVAWYAGKVSNMLPASAGLAFEDLYNSGYLALTSAVERYEGGGEFIALFMLCLKTAFAEAAGNRRGLDPLRRLNTRSLDEPLPGCEDVTLCDTIADNRNDYEDAEHRVFIEQLHAELEKALNALPETEAFTIRGRYYEELTQKAVGQMLGISHQYARQIEQQALRKLRSPKISRPLRQFIEEKTPYYMHVGVNRFNSTGSSAPEHLTIMREQWAAQE